MTGQNTPVCLIRVIQYSYIHKSTKAQRALKAVWQVKSFVFITISDGFCAPILILYYNVSLPRSRLTPLPLHPTSSSRTPSPHTRSPSSPLISPTPPSKYKQTNNKMMSTPNIAPLVVPAVARSLKNIAPSSQNNSISGPPDLSIFGPPNPSISGPPDPNQLSNNIPTLSSNQVCPAQPNYLRLQELQNKCFQ